jgi:glycosyltransferase involved in cell wall biosynthesis
VKLLVVASSLDLRAPLSATPSWWQLLKALAEQGVQLVVAPYQGPAIESPWWTAAANPCQREGDAIRVLKPVTRGHLSATSGSRTSGDLLADRLIRGVANGVTKPKWRRHLVRLLAEHRDTDAVVFLTVPPNHFGGVPRELRHRYGVPTYLYDGDVPASLPRFSGFHGGFKIYQGADLGEYEAVISNSLGGAEELRRLGATKVHVLYYAADPSLLRPISAGEDIDVFFFGRDAQYRQQWIEAMLTKPSRELSEARFAVRGIDLGPLGCVRMLPYLSFSALREYCCRSRVNLLITRDPHAHVYGSSSARPFELAALGRAMVSNPYLGIQEWFEPGSEVLIVHDAEEATSTYRWLLRDAPARFELGHRARKRLLEEHTYDHRAAKLRKLLENTAS